MVKKGLFSGKLCLILWLCVSPAQAATVFTFENMGGATIDYTRYEFDGVQDVAQESFTGQSFDTYWQAGNGFFWGTPGNTLPDVNSSVVTLHTTAPASGAGLSFAGGANTDWGVDYYTAYGFGVSSLFVNDTSSAAYQAINITAYPITLRDTVSVFASSSAENQTFLFGYDSSASRAEVPFIPTIYFADAVDLKSIDFANTAYAYKILNEGTTYAQAFPDEFGVEVFGLNENGTRITDAHAKVILSAGANVVNDWLTFDFEADPLSDFENIHGLQFEIFSSDSGTFGINSPMYFALDNVTLADGGLVPQPGAGVPEPATWCLLLLGLVCVSIRKFRSLQPQ